MKNLRKVDLVETLTRIDEHWSPRIVGEVNDQHVKLAKIRGTFDWHHHENEDELFLVLHGTLVMRLRDREVTLEPGTMFIVPRGVEHQPHAEEEVHILLFEPATTRNTGNVTTERTIESPEWL